MRWSIALLTLLLLSCATSSTPDLYCRGLHLEVPDRTSVPARAYLGILIKEADTDRGLCPQVTGLLRGGPAEISGIRKGDILISLDGFPVCEKRRGTPSRLRDLVRQTPPGSDVVIEVLRNGRPLSIPVTLRPLPIRKISIPALTESCPEGPSLLEEALRRNGKMETFQKVISELRVQSLVLHNPEWSDNPFQRSIFSRMIWYPLRAASSATSLTDRLRKATGPDSLFRQVAGMLDIRVEREDCERLTLSRLLSLMEDTSRNLEELLQVLTPDQRGFILRVLEKKDISAEDWNRLLNLSLRVDLRRLINEIYPLIGCFNRTSLEDLRKDILMRFGRPAEGILFEESTPYGTIIIAGEGPDTHRDDAFLIIDLGGDDLYLNNSGGSRPGMPLSVVIDYGGDDRYISREPFVQGAGVVGSGILVDLSGEDIFVSGPGSQGAGLLGVGILWNRGGKSVFISSWLSQAAGEAGTGILLSEDGDTLYRTGLYGQGLGLSGGIGVLVDRGGDDRYILGGVEPDFRDPEHSTVSMGQGFGRGVRPKDGYSGASGGVGVLIDESGDDLYSGDYFAQGGAYYYGVGILRDISGNDRYIGGRYTQGAGIHTAVGVMIDDRGRDSYYASYGVAQGMGHDHGVGLLMDLEGDDSFEGRILSQGACTDGSIGLLISASIKGVHLNKTEGCIGVRMQSP